MRSHQLRLLLLAALYLFSLPVVSQEAEEPTQVDQLALTVWWPDVLLPDAEGEIGELIEAQTAAFVETQNDVQIVNRQRLVGRVGGVVATIRAGRRIAPDALPDLTLVQRQDLSTLLQLQTLQSLEGRVTSALTGDLGPALGLGQVDGTLYGLPYVLDLSHVIYRPQAGIDYTSWRFDDVLARNETFTFPASAQNRLNNTVLLQYLAAGGTLDAEGELSLDEEALMEVLSFYERASDNQIIDGFALNYTSPSAYLDDFLSGDLLGGIFNSTIYLQQSLVDPSLGIAPLPMPDGQNASILDGWMWVLTSTDPDKQEIAVAYINWMMSTQQLSAYAQTAQRLPALQSILDALVADELVAADYVALLDETTLVTTATGTVASAIQDALVSVLTAELTAAEASERALAQIGR